jgi:uncharacterized phage-associated protein
MTSHKDPLLAENFEAQEFGPAIPELWFRFHLKWKDLPIDDEFPCPDIPQDVRDHLLVILERYFFCDNSYLDYFSCCDKAWRMARDYGATLVIDKELMRYANVP